MRVKTDARRNAIVAAAWKVFRECGYEGTTMSAINARAGGSKATIYNYFPSKAELFSAALEYGLLETSGQAFRHLSGSGCLKDRLLCFARAHLAGRMSPEMVAIDRILVMEAFRSDVFEVIREKSFLKRRMIADQLEPEMAAGRLRDDDPLRAAVHLLALIEADLLERHLHGDRSITGEMIEEQVHIGVETFLRAYAPKEGAAP